ncbi:hypothetical protein [Pasteurella canis]|uniref:hypothetical protein n=1 Tax=Pasteurella canis TaxID=753 RepID=UPI001CBF2E85|nr:hypothetical protein [Pasteurella canis]UAX42661.1 hypothetical protein K7G89_000495 [Pasteurella canis]
MNYISYIIENTIMSSKIRKDKLIKEHNRLFFSSITKISLNKELLKSLLITLASLLFFSLPTQSYIDIPKIVNEIIQHNRLKNLKNDALYNGKKGTISYSY